MREKCPYCQSRFERSPGDTIGGVYINVALAELSALAGFFTVDAVLHPPILHQLYFWIPYVLVFCALFYRHARGLWLAVLHLTGAIYPDPDYEREYISPRHVRRGKTPQRHE